MGLNRFLVLLAAGLVACLVLAVWFFPPNDDFRAENPFWNGLADINRDHGIEYLSSMSGLDALPSGTTFIVIPYVEYTPGEIERLREYVSGGGRLILADDFGYGNGILEGLGLGARFTGDIILDPIVNYRERELPRAIHMQSGPLLSNVDELVLNHATSLTDVNVENIMAESSSFSYLDTNADGSRGSDEPQGPLPVISRHDFGAGQIVLMSDPSLLINGMDFPGNERMVANLVATSSGVYIDQAHLPETELISSKNWLAQVRDLLAAPAGTLGLVMAALLAALFPVWRKVPFSVK